MRKLYIITTVLIFLALGGCVFIFYASYLRFWESIIDFGYSVAYYFCTLFGIKNGITATVVNRSAYLEWYAVLPSDFEGFTQSSKSYFGLLFSLDNFKAWGLAVAGVIENIAKVLLIILPCIIILFISLKLIYRKCNIKHNKDTLPLKVWKAVAKVTYQPMKKYINGYKEFVKSHGWIWKIWLTVIIFHFNLSTIIVEFIAYYLYFAVSYDFGTLYTQLCKLIIDLQSVLKRFPWHTLLTIAWLIFCWWRKKIAKNKLRHMEAKDCGFINELPIVSIACGSMGKKKTTLITDMALSQEAMFRRKALEIIQNNDMKFPHFPWIKFEDDLKANIRCGSIYNLATVKAWVEELRTNGDYGLYGYDYGRYGCVYNDNLKVSDLFDVLEVYAQAYFIYIVESSLIVSNYSIRTDNEMLYKGNFPLWFTDFFTDGITTGRHSHILDFDTLRLGKKIIENNPNAGSFEFGVIAISEIGKERGNMLELKEIKKGTFETNQKNDLFNAWLKMCRHSATVDNFPFIKVFTDEQRPESWGADARDLCDVIHIISTGEQRLALPFYTLEQAISEWAFNKFMPFYTDMRYRRGDNTLLVHILKSVTAWIWKRNVKIYNSYGYSTLNIEKERGTMDGKTEVKEYYLMNRKIYARRFSTDCFSDYFNELAGKSKVGLNDYLEYATERATVEELKAQNSYFINSLYG